MTGVGKSTFIYYSLIGQINKIIDRWNKIGVLEGLSKRKKEKCAIYFEECFKYLTTSQNNDSAIEIEDFEIIIFPIIYKVISKIKLMDNFNIHNMITCFFKYYENNISKLYEIQNIDVEAELCVGFSNYYIKNIRLIKNN